MVLTSDHLPNSSNASQPLRPDDDGDDDGYCHFATKSESTTGGKQNQKVKNES